MKKTGKNKFKRTMIFKNILLIIILVSGQLSMAQTTPIEFDFATKKGFYELPFDKSFSIKLLNIPNDYDRVKVRFLKNGLPAKTEIASEEWQRDPRGAETSGIITFDLKLAPNSEYTVEVEPYIKADLTAIEKSGLIAALKRDSEIREIINKEAFRFINVTDAMVPYDPLSLTQEEIKKVANRVVVKVNKDYKINPIDPNTQLVALSKFMTSLNNLRQELDNLQNSQLLSSYPAKKGKISGMISSLKESLKTVNWGDIALTDNNYTQLTIVKDAIFSEFEVKGQLPAEATTKKQNVEFYLDETITNRDAWLNTIVQSTIVLKTYKLSSLGTTYSAEFAKNARSYITLDVGIAYVGNVDRVMTYSGVSIYFRPIDKNAPSKNYHGFDRWVAVKTSFLLGITMNSIEEPNIRKGLIGNSALVLGLGYKVNLFLKINAGCFVYYKYSNNPLISQQSYYTKASPFISLSIDLDAKELFSGIGNSIFK
jgi:hypothetical protein